MFKKHSALGIVGSLLFSVLLSGGLASAQQKPSPTQEPSEQSCPCGQMGGGKGHCMCGMCGKLSQIADVSVENSPNGAILRLTAKDPTQIEAIRRSAQQMATCIKSKTKP